MEGRLLVKSGTDFLDLSRIRLTCYCEGEEGKEEGGAATEEGRRLRFHVERHRITRKCPVDEDIERVVASYRQRLCGKMGQVIGETEVPLQGLFARVRTSETNLGNFVCDCMRSATRADVALLNSGTLRVDRVIPAGVVKMRDLGPLRACAKPPLTCPHPPRRRRRRRRRSGHAPHDGRADGHFNHGQAAEGCAGEWRVSGACARRRAWCRVAAMRGCSGWARVHVFLGTRAL